MNRYVTDTHSLYWYLINSPRLSAQANAAFDEADNGAARIIVPAIVLAELYFLNKKQGFPLDTSAVIAELTRSAQFEVLSFAGQDVLDFDADAAVPEMHDRIIVGVARRLGVPCITCDSQIIASGSVAIVW
jgi:PIN domain nuclease of toxin-antitoxin system